VNSNAPLPAALLLSGENKVRGVTRRVGFERRQSLMAGEFGFCETFPEND
jgi:hypothetical protein